MHPPTHTHTHTHTHPQTHTPLFPSAPLPCLHKPQASPLLFVALLSGHVHGWVSEDVQKDGLELLEDDSGHGKVSLQAVHFVAKLLVQVCHVRPLAHFVEELDQTGQASKQTLKNNIKL